MDGWRTAHPSVCQAVVLDMRRAPDETEADAELVSTKLARGETWVRHDGVARLHPHGPQSVRPTRTNPMAWAYTHAFRRLQSVDELALMFGDLDVLRDRIHTRDDEPSPQMIKRETKQTTSLLGGVSGTENGPSGAMW